MCKSGIFSYVSNGLCCIIIAECEFETPKICGYTQDAGDEFDWTRGSGGTISYDTGPKSDHTYGTASGKFCTEYIAIFFLAS